MSKSSNRWKHYHITISEIIRLASGSGFYFALAAFLDLKLFALVTLVTLQTQALVPLIAGGTQQTLAIGIDAERTKQVSILSHAYFYRLVPASFLASFGIWFLNRTEFSFYTVLIVAFSELAAILPWIWISSLESGLGRSDRSLIAGMTVAFLRTLQLCIVLHFGCTESALKIAAFAISVAAVVMLVTKQYLHLPGKMSESVKNNSKNNAKVNIAYSLSDIFETFAVTHFLSFEAIAVYGITRKICQVIGVGSKGVFLANLRQWKIFVGENLKQKAIVIERSVLSIDTLTAVVIVAFGIFLNQQVLQMDGQFLFSMILLAGYQIFRNLSFVSGDMLVGVGKSENRVKIVWATSIFRNLVLMVVSSLLLVMGFFTLIHFLLLKLIVEIVSTFWSRRFAYEN